MSCDHCHKEQEGFNPEIRIRWCWLSLDESFTHTVPSVQCNENNGIRCF